ncbi:MAG: hypothetical protein P4M09_30630 [Devosia sp.]|nr:hypothetical protein [Devosia sp.]
MKSDGIAGMRGLRIMGAGVLVLSLAGCGLDMFGAGSDSSQAANASATPAQMAQGQASALPAIATECPPIKIQPGAEALFFYGNGHAGNAQSLHYQVDFEKETRNCVVSNGLITVKMGVIGRVLLGPSGTETSVNVPLRFTVDRNGAAVFSEKYSIPVAITPPAQSQEFVKVVDNVAIPYLGGEDIVIWVGFEAGNAGRPTGRPSPTPSSDGTGQ